MAADSVKSTSITNLDASPVAANTAGKGAEGDLRELSDYAAATAAGLADTTSKYKVIRLPSNCKLKRMRVVTTDQLDSNASATLAVDVGAYYSDSTTDGTQGSLQGTAIDVNCFAAAADFGHAASGDDIDGLSAFSVANRMKELWDALGLSSDPGGFIDVVVAVETAAATGAAGDIMVSADFVR